MNLCCSESGPNILVKPPLLMLEFSSRNEHDGSIITECMPYSLQSIGKYSSFKRIKHLNRDLLYTLKILKDNDSIFFDNEFGHNREAVSLIIEPLIYQIIWERVARLVSYPIYSKAQSSVVNKQNYGNLQLQRALSILSRIAPDCYSELITKELNPFGIYEFRYIILSRRILHGGIIEKVLIDDYVPTVDGKPIFAAFCNVNEAYLMLIQKAIAKVCGSYNHIPASAHQLAQMLLCGPVQIKLLSEVKGSASLLESIVTALKQQQIVLAQTKLDPGLRKHGICENTSYQVVNCHLVHQKSKDSLTLVELISQNKSVSWSGNYNIADSLWDSIETLDKDKIFSTMKQNRSFCLDARDFSHFFEQLAIFEPDSTINKDWLSARSDAGRPVFAAFSLERDEILFLRALTFKAIRQSITVAKKTSNGLVLVFSKLTMGAKQLEDRIALGKGDYLVCLIHDWIFDTSGKFALFLTSRNCHVDLQSVQASEHSNFLLEILGPMKTPGKQLYSIDMHAETVGFAAFTVHPENFKHNEVTLLIDQNSLKQQQWQIQQPHTNSERIHIRKGDTELHNRRLVLKYMGSHLRHTPHFPTNAFRVKE